MPHLWEGTPARPKGKKPMAHQSARAPSTGGQGGQLHLVAAWQPPLRSSAQRQVGGVKHPPEPAGTERGIAAPCLAGSGAHGWSARGEVPRGCGSPASRGGGFVPWSLWPQLAAEASRRQEPRRLARSAVHPARMRTRRGRRWAGEGWTCPGPPGGSGPAGSWVHSPPRVARKPPHATERLALGARRRGGGPGGSSSNSSEQRGRDIVTAELLTLSVTFPVNGTKKLQTAAKRGERSQGEEVGGYFCLLATQKCRCRRGAGVIRGGCPGSSAPPRVLPLPR
ncbi:uncharacterized protein LOC110596571 [Carlito syrichta]|uniref:Uncharacterized protein LOC110596571 n=1 Tax=Carlito syrichta TaxID=1868482 RepID=A0A3Q0ECV1_CARSF|nr:uncharacterized protein LOC110596571 [Carlito syrichta]